MRTILVNRRGVIVAAVVAAFLVPEQSRADNLNSNFVVPSFYGDPNSTYQEWHDNFTLSGNSPPTQDGTGIANNPYGTANFTDTSYPSDGAFVIGKQTDGSGDIYSFSGVISPQIVVPTAGVGDFTEIVFQFETYGQANPDLSTSLDVPSSIPSDLSLVGPSGASLDILSQSIELEATASSQFGGFGTAYTNDYVATWIVTGDATSYQVDYNAEVTSSAFDATRVDTITLSSVPEPGSIVSMSIGLIVMLSWWRIHRRPRRGLRGLLPRLG